MRDELEKALLKHKTITITLDQLDDLVPPSYDSESFALLINELENDDILKMVKSAGRNKSRPSVAFRYKINKSKLKKSFYKELQHYRLQFHESINLDAYFSLSERTWQGDLPYLKLLNLFLNTHGLPDTKVPAPERSFQLVGDEKRLEKGGLSILKRTKLLDLMKIYPVADPLMFAINPHTVTNENHLHLIVENKTTYDALLHSLTDTVFSTLIYGSGTKIVKSIENFPYQYPVSGLHSFFYFGDIDRSGITIWHSLHRVKEVIPAFPFYEACFKHEKAFGKTNQDKNKRAINEFLAFFQKEMQEKISTLIDEGAYYPQEVLKTEELQKIFKQADWENIKVDI